MKCDCCGKSLGFMSKYVSLSDGGICKKCFENLGFDFNYADQYSNATCDQIRSGYGYYTKHMNSEPEEQVETDVLELNVAGYDYKQNELKGLLEYINDEYTLSKKAFLEEVTDRVYQYDTEYHPAQLVREPKNEYDPNAIAVYVDNVHIGYIAKKDQKRIDLERIESAEVEVYGGKFKEIDFDEYEETIRQGETPYKAKLYVTLKKEGQ